MARHCAPPAASATAASPSAFCWVMAPAMVTGAMAPASVNGEMNTPPAPRRAARMAPVQHGPVMLQRRGRVDVGEHVRACLELLVGHAAGYAHHLHHVLDPLRAERIGVDHLVGEREHVVMRVEMPNRGVDVDWLDRIAAVEMYAVVGLGKAKKVLKIGGAFQPFCRGQDP